MSEMVERVAAALMKRMTAIYFDADWDSQPEEVKEDWRLNARAAIEAMREPTDDMLLMAKEAVKDHSEWGCEWLESDGECWKTGWRAMIDEALR